MSEPKPLRDKQQRFVDEYLIDLNASQAALRAGYSPHTAPYIGAENLKKPQIQAALALRRAALEDEVEVKQHKVLQEYIALAFSDMREYVLWGPGGVELKSSDMLTDTAAKAVQEVVSTTKTRTYVDKDGGSATTVEVQTRFKLYNKQAALRDLAEHLNLFGVGKGVVDDEFLLGFVEVVKQHASGDETRQAIIGYLRHYLGTIAA